MENNEFTRRIAALGDQKSKTRNYWLNRLEGLPVKSNFPYDYKKKGSEMPDAKASFKLSGQLFSGLLKLARGSDYKLHMVLAAALAALLRKYTGNTDIITGTPIYKQENPGEFINTVLPLRIRIDETVTFKELVLQVRETIVAAVEHQNFPIELLHHRLNVSAEGTEPTDDFLLFDVFILLENIHDRSYTRHIKPGMTFALAKEEEYIEGTLEYSSLLYERRTAEQITRHFCRLLEKVLADTDLPIKAVEILAEDEKKRVLEEFNDTAARWPQDKTVYELFAEQVEKNPGHIAVIDLSAGAFTYGELNRKINRLANYLYLEKNIRADHRVGLLMDKSFDCIVAILAIQAAGGSYVPIDPGLPEERTVEIIEDADIAVLISGKKYIKTLNRLQWQCRGLHTFLCLDSRDVYKEEEEQSTLMDKKLWEYVGESAVDDITGGGWKSSYTGLPISKEEMEEYSRNGLEKLTPLLHKNARVLEIGCATGLTMYLVAPKVGLYYGTDLSSVIIARNRERIEAEGHSNIRLECLPAHDIEKIAEKNFDLIILNSVIQHFSGHNYLREVIKKALGLLGPGGTLFIGDIMDLDRKEALIRDLCDFKKAHRRSDYRTKTDWSEELFISHSFFHDLSVDIPAIRSVEFSEKIGTIENELTKFRYDALVTVDKTKGAGFTGRVKHKYQDDLRALERQSSQKKSSRVEPLHLLYIIYTSGTTGKPKGVMIEHRNVARLMVNDRFLFDFNNRDVWTMFHSYNFDFSVWEMYGALLYGGKLVIIPRMTARDTAEYLTVLAREGVTVLNQTPSAFYSLTDVESGRRGFALKLRYVIFGGEALNPLKLKSFKEKYPGVKLVNMYGITETTVHVTHKEITSVEIETGSRSIGKPIPTLSVNIMDRDFHLVPLGAAGELYVGGDGVARGYLNRPELTAEKFCLRRPGTFLKKGSRTSKNLLLNQSPLYHTGDLGRWLPNGNIEFLGRSDHQVKIRGFRIELGEIESHLRSHGAVQEVVVIVKDDGYGDRYLCAYVVGEDKLDAQGLKGYLKKKLPGYMIPAYFVSLARIPLTANGKLDVRALPEPAAAASGDNYIAPGDHMESKLVEIWSKILKIDQSAIGIDDDFFELGGHSLRATVVVSNVHKELHTKVPLAEIFKTPTIRALARYIKGKTEDKFISIPPVEEKEYYSLSSAQKRLYILQQMELDSIAYNMPEFFLLPGEFDLNKIEAAFKLMLIRHESFRTSFAVVNDIPVQQIHDEVKLELEYCENLREFVRAFDLSRAPLLHVGVTKNTAGNHLLLVDMHHIISDGISHKIMIKDFLALHRGEVLPPLRIQYKDYSEWQNSKKEIRAKKQQEAYWGKRFEDEIPVLDLTADYPRPAVQSFEGSSLEFELTTGEFRALNDFTLNTGTTLYMVLLAIYYVLLSKISGQEDIVIGAPIAARRHTDLEGIIGMFVNTLALRNYPAGEKIFEDFLVEVKQETLGAFENREYPFEDLVEKLVQTRDPSRNPLFDTAFLVQNMETQAEGIPITEISQLKVNIYKSEVTTAKFDILLSCIENEAGHLVFFFNYCTRLFKRETIERFCIYYRNILSTLIRYPKLKLSMVEIITEEEKQRILYEFNDTLGDYPGDKTIHELFRQQVDKNPDRIALLGQKDISITYKELNERASVLAHRLQERGVGPESITAIMGERTVEMINGILGILKSGSAYMPIDPGYPEERLKYMLKDGNVKFLVTNSNIIRDFSLPEDIHVVFTDGLINKNRPRGTTFYLHPSRRYAPVTSLAYIMYTSGSTGKPKGVMVEHKNVIRLVMNCDYVELTENSRILQTGAPVFDAVTFEIWGSLLNGGRLYPADNKVILDANKLGSALKDCQINTMWLSSPLFNQLVQQSSDIFSTLEYLVVGGDVLSPRLIARVRNKNRSLQVVNGYGPTENTTFSVCCLIDRDYEDNIPIGSPIANSTAYIVDKYNRLQPIGIPGELYVGGDGVSRGYLNSPELTSEKFVRVVNSHIHPSKKLSKSTDDQYPMTNDRLYKTGDLARWLPDGNIEFSGRMDHQVKLRGFRVELAEIENRFLSHPAVKEVVVLAKKDGKGDKYLCAYVVSRVKMAAAELRVFLGKNLPGYMIPSYFVWLDRIPLTVNGKINLNALPLPQFKLEENHSAPRTGIEKKLGVIWREVLGIDSPGVKPGIDDDFFELGGQSLKATSLVAKVYKEFNVILPLEEIFINPTIRELAKYIKETAKDKYQYQSIEPVEKKEYYQVSSAQKRLYVLKGLKGENIGYNMPQFIYLGKSIEKEKLEDAFKKLVIRHASLRTSFYMLKDKPVQRVHDNVEFKIQFVSMEPGAWAAKHPDTNSISKDFIRPFDLSNAPLLRVRLIKTREQKYLLLFDMHHIITDGISQDILTREFQTLYQGGVLPPLRLQYNDYSEWENSRHRREFIQQQESYWLKMFSGGGPLLHLPTDYPRPETRDFEGDSFPFEIDEALTGKIKQLVSGTDTTLFMLLLAVYTILLSKYTRQEDVVVGTPVTGKTHADLQNIVGMFVNMIAMRNYPEPRKGFQEFLAEVKENSLGGLENQDYPFDLLVFKLGAGTDISRHPLFDVVFALQNFNPLPHKNRETAEPQPAVIPYQYKKEYEMGHKTSKFDLELVAVEIGKKIQLNFDYRTRLFKRETIEGMSRHFLNILNEVIIKPVIKIADINMLTPEEREPLKEIIKKAPGKLEANFNF